MTARKSDLRLPSRTPSYVTRETGSAECEVSPETWDRWEREGRLPQRCTGFPDNMPRWRWADVDAKLSGRKPPEAVEAAPVDDGGVAGAANLRGKKAVRNDVSA